MRIFLAGVSCVGKSTIGARLAERLGFDFCDLDVAAEAYYCMPIRRFYKMVSTATFLRRMATVLEDRLLSADDIVIALPPSGLMGALWKTVNWLDDTKIIV